MKKASLSLSSGFAIFILVLFTGLSLAVQLSFVDMSNNEVNMELSFAEPSPEAPMGRDFMGRSYLTKVLAGLPIALGVGFFSASLSTFVGLFLGLASGYFRGWVDKLIVWLYTSLESIPYILLISALSFSLGPGLIKLYIALGLTGWVNLCRLSRTEVLKQSQLDYVLAGQALGLSHWRQMAYHILPNIKSIVKIQFSLQFIYAIKLEVLLSFIGLGVEPGTPSWGVMIFDAKDELSQGHWMGFISVSLAFFLLIFSVFWLTGHLNTNSGSTLHLNAIARKKMVPIFKTFS